MGNCCFSKSPGRSDEDAILIKMNDAKKEKRDDSNGQELPVARSDVTILGVSDGLARINEPSIVLLPHEHSLFCERKQRVCTAVGKLQELENLRFIFSETDSVSEWYWVRIGPALSSPIENSKNQVVYQLTKDDVNMSIGVKYTTAMSSGNSNSTNILGPIIPGPPRVLDFVIVGSCKVGSSVEARARYIGGSEGPSEYWWIRVTKDGKRVQITEPISIKSLGHDPRRYVITKDDVGCTLKAKCRPIRTDKIQGEIFTSKSSLAVSD